jgi:hypothetical protein
VAYSEMLPGLLKTLEERRAEKMASPMALMGQSLMRSPVPQFESPWATIGTRLAQTLIGGAMTGYSDAIAQDEYQRERSAMMSSLPKVVDTLSRTSGMSTADKVAALSAVAGPELASQFVMEEAMQGLDRQQMLQDPNYLLDERRVMTQEAESRARLGEIALRRQEADTARLQAQAQLGVEGAGKAYSLIETYRKSSPAFQKAQDFRSRQKELVELLGEFDKSPEAANYIGQKALEAFAKLPNEALMSDDRFAALANMSVESRIKAFTTMFKDGVIPKSEVEKMQKVVDAQYRGFNTAAEQDWRKNYEPRYNQIVRNYKVSKEEAEAIAPIFEKMQERVVAQRPPVEEKAPTIQHSDTVGGQSLKALENLIGYVYNSMTK